MDTDVNGQPESLDVAIDIYMAALKTYESTQGCTSYSVIEIPKLYIADCILKLRTAPYSYENPYVSGPQKAQSPMPSKGQRTVSPTKRWEVFKRDNYRCVICHADTDLTVDHILPQSKGGHDQEDNLQTLCRNCNSIKGVKTLPFQRKL